MIKSKKLKVGLQVSLINSIEIEKIIKSKFEADEAEQIYIKQIVSVIEKEGRPQQFYRRCRITIGEIFTIHTEKFLMFTQNQKIKNINSQKKPF